MIPLDYALFAGLSLAAFFGIDVWLKQPSRGGRIPAWAWILCVVVLFFGFFLVENAGDHEKRNIQKMLEGFAPTYASELTRMGHAELSTDAAPDDPAYLAMIDAEIRWLKVNPVVHDIYTLRKLPDGSNVLIVDSETDYDRNGRYEGERESRTPVGEKYDVYDDGIERAFRGEANFDSVPSTDRWGTWVSASVPMRGPDGRIEAVLGVDYNAGDLQTTVLRGRLTAIGILTAILIVIAAAVATITNLRLNIRKRQRMEEELSHAKQEAEAASMAKGEFLANMSHEIRTPLNGIIGMVDLLRDTDLSSRQKDFLDALKESSTDLSSLLGDILDFSKIEAGKFNLDSIPFSVRDCVEGAMKPLRYRAQSRGLSIEARIDDSIPEILMGDPARFRQVLSNLASNAVKFTEQGGVSIEVFNEIENRETVRLRVTVSDTGIGIPRHKLGAIFDTFTQSDSSITRRYGGTGLGLAIVSKLVRLMDGRIWAESEEGHGSRFHATIALGKPPTGVDLPRRPEPTGAKKTSINLSVLLAEDTAINQVVTINILEKRGHRVTVAANGVQVLEELERKVFDLILMDVQMPEMDGLETTRRIRNDERETGGHIPIIAMTAHALAGDRQAILDAGMDEYLPKPVDAERLLELIDDVVGNKRTAAPAGAPAWHPDDLRAKLGGNRDLLTQIVALFEEDRKRLLAEIETAVKRKDAGALEKAAHALRGCIGNFRYQEAFDRAGELERMGREGRLDGSEVVAARLGESLERLSQLLQDL